MSPLTRLREHLSMMAGSLSADITDCLYLGELLHEPPPRGSAVYFAALHHLTRLPLWRLWIASKALGVRPIEDYLDQETEP